MKFWHRIKEGLYAYSGLLMGEKPVLICGPGRSGSMALLADLRRAGVYAFKVESFFSEHRGSVRFVKKHILSKNRVHIITLVRDPVSVMASYYFSKAGRGRIQGAKEALENENIDEMRRIFIDDVLRTTRTKRHLYWYEEEFKKALGIDVYAYPFETDKQQTVISHERYPTLILRTELDNDAKKQAVAKFLGITGLTVTLSNARAHKPLYELFQTFKKRLCLPADIIDELYSSPMAQHFFSKDEVRELKAKWSEHTVDV